VYAAVRELGSEVDYDGCDFEEDRGFVDHTCNTLEDVDAWNCKLFSYEFGNIIVL